MRRWAYTDGNEGIRRKKETLEMLQRGPIAPYPKCEANIFAS